MIPLHIYGLKKRSLSTVRPLNEVEAVTFPTKAASPLLKKRSLFCSGLCSSLRNCIAVPSCTFICISQFIYSVHVPVYFLQQRVQGSFLCRLNFLHQLSMLSDQLPEVSQLLQQPGEKEGVIWVIGQQVEPQRLNNVFLQLLYYRYVYQAWTIFGSSGGGQDNEEGKFKYVFFSFKLLFYHLLSAFYLRSR